MVKKENIKEMDKDLSIMSKFLLQIVAEKDPNMTVLNKSLRNVDLNAIYDEENGYTLGYLACMLAKSPKVIKCLIEHGLDLNTTDKFGDTLLISAAKLDQEEKIKWLLENGANPDIKNNNGDDYKTFINLQKHIVDFQTDQYIKLEKLITYVCAIVHLNAKLNLNKDVPLCQEYAEKEYMKLGVNYSKNDDNLFNYVMKTVDDAKNEDDICRLMGGFLALLKEEFPSLIKDIATDVDKMIMFRDYVILSIIHRVYEIALCQLMYNFPEFPITMNQTVENSKTIKSVFSKGIMKNFNCFSVVMPKLEDDFKKSNLSARAFLKKSIENILDGKDIPVVSYAFPGFIIN